MDHFYSIGHVAGQGGDVRLQTAGLQCPEVIHLHHRENPLARLDDLERDLEVAPLVPPLYDLDLLHIDRPCAIGRVYQGDRIRRFRHSNQGVPLDNNATTTGNNVVFQQKSGDLQTTKRLSGILYPPCFSERVFVDRLPTPKLAVGVQHRKADPTKGGWL